MFNARTLNEEQIKVILDMAIVYLDINDYGELAKTIILRFMNNNLDLEFPLIRIFSKEYIKLEDEKKFLQDIVGSKASKKIVWSFINYLEENVLSIVDYADIIIKLCELYQTNKSNISKHIKNILEEGELEKISVVRKFRTTGADGKNYNITHYNLDMIISIGYRVKSLIATQFRRWATERLKEYVIKGFTMDDERLKNLGGGNY